MEGILRTNVLNFYVPIATVSREAASKKLAMLNTSNTYEKEFHFLVGQVKRPEQPLMARTEPWQRHELDLQI